MFIKDTKIDAYKIILISRKLFVLLYVSVVFTLSQVNNLS